MHLKCDLYIHPCRLLNTLCFDKNKSLIALHLPPSTPAAADVILLHVSPQSPDKDFIEQQTPMLTRRTVSLSTFPFPCAAIVRMMIIMNLLCSVTHVPISKKINKRRRRNEDKNIIMDTIDINL